jgi:hypothetical protein
MGSITTEFLTERRRQSHRRSDTGTTQPGSVRATPINPVLYKEDANE